MCLACPPHSHCLSVPFASERWSPSQKRLAGGLLRFPALDDTRNGERLPERLTIGAQRVTASPVSKLSSAQLRRQPGAKSQRIATSMRLRFQQA
jgi:hypothetical protein